MAKKKQKNVRKREVYYDFNLLAVVLLLACFGLVMLYSTSAYTAQIEFNDDMYFFKRQALITVASIAVAVFVSRLDYHLLFYVSGFIYLVSLFLMALVKFSPLGVEVNGATRWLKLGVQFQPSEIAKIAAITFIPCLILKLGKKVSTKRGMLLLLFVGVLLAGSAYILTDNLSTGLIIGGITILMIFIAHPNTWIFLFFGTLSVILVVIIKIVLQSNLDGMALSVDNFRVARFLVWLDPEQYSADGGYQIIQALYAIGSGGFFGKGIGNSVQKLGPVPEAQNDMIFSIVCEELGVFGGLIVLVLFGYMLYRLFFIAENAPDFYGSLMVSGIFIHIALQVVLNICVVLNWIPTTGITLPFISYGGTSIVFLMAEMGVALSVSRQIRFTE